MISRRELEGLVTVAIQDIRTVESNLERRYRSLERAGVSKRLSFLNSVEALARRVSDLERMLDQLEIQSQTLTAA